MIFQSVLEFKIILTKIVLMGRKINYINPRCKMTESIGPKKTQIAIRDIKKKFFFNLF